MAEDRLTCMVVGCGHTIAKRRLPEEHTEWLCHACWRNVSRHTKRLLHHNRRRAKRYGWNWGRQLVEHRIWERCKKEATEAALGIG